MADDTEVLMCTWWREVVHRLVARRESRDSYSPSGGRTCSGNVVSSISGLCGKFGRMSPLEHPLASFLLELFSHYVLYLVYPVKLGD